MDQQPTFSRGSIRDDIAQTLNIPAESIPFDANLIQLGLDSMRIMRLAGNWRKQGSEVNFALLADSPTIHQWQELLAGKSATRVPHKVEEHPQKLVDNSDLHIPFPLADMQHAYWIGRTDGQTLGGVSAHLYVEFDGTNLNPSLLKKAVYKLAQLHPMLRARFLPDGTQQILAEPPSEIFTCIDLTDKSAEEVKHSLNTLRDNKSQQKLKIENGQVIDLTLTLLPDNKTRIHLDVDMLAGDAMSYRLLIHDLAELYSGHTKEPSNYTYRQYLIDREKIANPAIAVDQRWWKKKLSDLPTAPALPLLSSSEQANADKTTRYHQWLDEESKKRFLLTAHKHGVTPAMVLASLFAETIGRWSSESQFLLNLPLFQREPLHADIDKIVGDFTSSVMLEVDVRKEMSTLERAKNLQKIMHDNSAHSTYSGLNILRDLSKYTGEQVLAPFVFTSALNLGELFSDAVSTVFGEPVWILSQGPQVLLDAQVTEIRGGLMINWDVRDNAFPPGVVSAMFDTFTRSIESLVKSDAAWTTEAIPQLPIEQLTVRQQVNDTSAPVSNRALHEGFFLNAQSRPTSDAILWAENKILTYAEVAAQALTIAGLLRSRGIRTGDTVAVQLPKGPEQIIAILGILAAGAAYVPIGFDQPHSRRDQILKTSEAAVAICLHKTQFRDFKILALPFSEAINFEYPLPEPTIVDNENIAYVIFTSGSTGTPKGVDIPHRAAMNTIDAVNSYFDITKNDRALVISALEFDASVYDIFGMFSAGGSLVVMDEQTRENPYAWVELVRRDKVTILNCIPSMLDMILNAAGGKLGNSLRAVLLGGDWVTSDLPIRLAKVLPNCRFAGLGGATETAIHFSICEVTDIPSHWTAVPFGKPLRNVQCRIVSPSGYDCPDWVTGELWVGGAGVARGYRNDLEKTAEKFVSYQGQNWYRTGDLARYWPDGTIEFLGRADHQVKIRGYRVELGEIEGTLRSIPGCNLAIATVIGKTAPKIAAAISLDVGSDVTSEDIILILQTLLPRYMVPSKMKVLDNIPLTTNGKLDRKAIHALFHDDDDDIGETYTLPRTYLEKAIARIFSEILQIRAVGVDEDFFSLGGDSVLATATIAKIREWLDAQNAVVADIFAARTVAELAKRLTASESNPKRLEQVAELYLDIMNMHEVDLANALDS
ncbi:MAG: amino acid adenylation domain-containing protein [Mycobacteriaceae bacterium]